MAAGHGVLPRECAVLDFVGSGSVDEQERDLFGVAPERGSAQGAAYKGDAYGFLGSLVFAFGAGRRVWFQAVVEEDCEAVGGVVTQGFFIGWVRAVAEQEFGELAPAGMGWLVGLAGGASAKYAG